MVKKESYSIVTIGYKSLVNLRACVEEAYASTLPPDEFIVIMNPYNDEIAKQISEYITSEPRITRFALMSQNVGVATAWNLGMAISTSEYIVILNDDCRVGPVTYKNMIAEFEDEGVGIVGVESGGNYGDVIYTAKGFLLAFRKSMFNEIGGYSEHSSPLADEREYGLRAWANGYKTSIARNCQWYHVHDISNHPNTQINYLGNIWIPARGVPVYINNTKDKIKGYEQVITKYIKR